MKYVTYSDKSSIPLLKNLVASATNQNIDLTVFSYDTETSEFCWNRRIPYEMIGTSNNNTLFKEWNTPDFGKFVLNKFDVLIYAIEKWKNFVFVDADVVFVKNPSNIHALRSILPETAHTKLIFQNSTPDTHPHCTGYFQTVSTDISKTKQVFDIFKKYHTEFLRYAPAINDQNVISLLLNDPVRLSSDDQAVFQGLVWEWLPTSEFPDGRVYFDWKKSQTPYIVHNNFIVGLDAKVSRFKENGLWFANP